VTLIIFWLEAGRMRTLLARSGCTVMERRHWLLWRRFDLVGSPEAVQEARAAVNAWRDDRWWNEHW
jgi:hypothetical protein